MAGNAAYAKSLVDEAQTFVVRARERLDEYDGKPLPEEQRAKIDEWSKRAIELKALADQAVSDADRDRKLTELADWAGQKQQWAKQSTGTLPNLAGIGVGESDDPSAPMIEVKSRDGQRRVVRLSDKSEVDYHMSFRKYLGRGVGNLNPAEYDVAEKKSLTAGVDIEGGFLVPEIFRAELIEAIEDAVFMRRLGRVLPPLSGAGSIRVPTAADLDDANWTVELGTGSLETAQPFGRRMLTPHPLAKRVKVSNTLLRLSGIDVEAWIRGELANRFSEAEERAFLVGTGVNQPEGVFNSPLVTPFVITNQTSVIADDLVNVEFQLKSQYRAGASWIINRTVLLAIAKLKDGHGQYMWRMGLTAGAPSTLLNYPVNESEYAPNTMTAGLNVFALGNWGRAYWIVDSTATQVQRLVELYAATNEIGFIGRREVDAMVVDGNGVVIAQLAP